MLTGAGRGSIADLPLETLVQVTAARSCPLRPGLALERKKIISLCIGPISIAEISAHLRLPLGVARVLVGDMAEEGLLTASASRQHAGPAHARTCQLLERVLDGLQAL